MKSFMERLRMAVMVLGFGWLLLSLLPMQALAQVTEQWVARYNLGEANALAVDAGGNVYVTGGGYCLRHD